MQQAEATQRLAIFRALQLGDMLCAVPALRAFRGLWPEAEVTLVGLPWARQFAARFPAYVDRFVEFPGHPGLPERRGTEAEYASFVAAMRAQRFDLAVQLHGDGRVSNGIVEQFGARRTAGFAPAGGPLPGPSGFLAYPGSGREVERLLALARHLGADPSRTELEFPLTPADRDEAAALVAPGSRYAVVHAGASSSEKRWSAAALAQVADALVERGLAVVLTGSAAERGLAAEVEAAMRTGPLNAAGRTSLGSLAALIDGAAVVVCNDTGVSHLADALSRPSVTVFVASDPARWAPADGRLHRAIDLRGRPAAAECGRVLAAAKALVDGGVRDAVA